MVPAIVILGLGFVLPTYLAVALVIGLLVALAFQTVLFRLIARTQNEVLRPWRSAVIALIVSVGDFLIASPIVELLQHGKAPTPKNAPNMLLLAASRASSALRHIKAAG
jgi:hypothetical protein